MGRKSVDQSTWKGGLGMQWVFLVGWQQRRSVIRHTVEGRRRTERHSKPRDSTRGSETRRWRGCTQTFDLLKSLGRTTTCASNQLCLGSPPCALGTRQSGSKEASPCVDARCAVHCSAMISSSWRAISVVQIAHNARGQDVARALVAHISLFARHLHRLTAICKHRPGFSARYGVSPS